MKTKADLVKGWLRKAESDLKNANMCISAGESLDTACFHAQQVAEKYLKAYLTAKDVDFPYIHNLEKLIELCGNHDPAFLTLKSLAQTLTPYAVELRYDDEFWPMAEIAKEALEAALKIKEMVINKLPKDMQIY